MFHFFHKWLNPHCPECQREKECKNCDVLRQLLETEKFENKMLLDKILGSNVKPEVQIQEEIKPILPKTITSLRVRREMMEENDRLANEVLKKKQQEIVPKSIEELEQELGVTSGS